MTGGRPASTPGQTVVTVAPSPRKAAEERSGISSASAIPRGGEPDRRQPNKKRDRVPGPGNHSDQKCAGNQHDQKEHDQASQSALSEAGCEALSAPRGASKCSTTASESGKASDPSERKAPVLATIVPKQKVSSGISTTGPAAADEPAMADG